MPYAPSIKLVSVLMPVYNVEKYIKEAIESVLMQTYQNIELIVVDDGSTDRTTEIVEQAVCLDPRVRLLKLGRNIGIVGALNEGLKHCSGDFVARIDGDDLMHSTKITTALSFLERNSDVGIVGSNLKLIDDVGQKLGEARFPSQHEEIVRASRYLNPLVHVWVARKCVYEELEGYREMAPAEDYDFLLRAILSGYKSANISDCISVVRFRDGNTLSSSSLRQKLAFNFIYMHFITGDLRDDAVAANFGNAVTENFFIKKVHSFSVLMLSKAITSQSFLPKFYFGLLALISPYTVQELFRRFLYKRSFSKNE
jgi:glycosyltransferase involved in cell wall biosynthesis